MNKLLGTSVLAVALLSVSAIALEQGPFTADQSRAGRALYVANCAACHGPELKGAGEAPPLAGTTFIAAWGNRSTEELYNLVKASMPYGNGNSLDADTYRRIVAYVLAANGAQPGAKGFSGSENIRINTIADGKTPAALAAEERAPARGEAGVARPPPLLSHTPVCPPGAGGGWVGPGGGGSRAYHPPPLPTLRPALASRWRVS